MDDQRSQSSCRVTEALNFGIDQILKSDTDSENRQPKERGKCAGRAVFTIAQKNWLEYYFQMEKYITKPNRKTLASALGLTDLQVKVWFQNRRMKWRHATSSNT